MDVHDALHTGLGLESRHRVDHLKLEKRNTKHENSWASSKQ